jgi:DNA-binding response OmpR family regulator
MNVATRPHRQPRSSLVDEPRVLLAEDDGELRMLFARALRDAGFDVHAAADGLEVLEILAAASANDAALPDALVMDVRMPRRSGLDVLKAIRTAGYEMPVVLVTGHGDATMRATAADLGASVVLDKPIDREDLVAVVELVVKLPREELSDG